MTRSPQPRLVVGVGASAGGLEAFKQLLSTLPADSGMAFLLVQHLDPTHESLLGELLTPLTEMRVREAEEGVRLEPDTVYIIRPDTALGVRRGRIAISKPTFHHGVRLPVNHLFRSLADEYGPRAVGIVLSGAGSDGSAGVRAIKTAGGLVIVQEPGSGAQPGMPQSAIDTGLVDLVLDIPEMAEALGRFSSLSPPPTGAGARPEAPDVGSNEQLNRLEEQDIRRLAAVLEAHLDFDLRVYKSGTIERRVLRRMTLSGFEDLEHYLAHLRTSSEEQQALVRDLLISVTEFFRDQDAFKALREMVIDPLVARATAGDTLRVWVPGCATGEEAYSIAMEFLDAIEIRKKRINLQVFATDVDRDALGFARAATYPVSIAEHVSTQRLETYFKPLDGTGYQARSRLRDVVSFALHDLTQDPPFSRMHLVSCRNVLIYLTPEAQKQVLKVLHFALIPDGHLFLGTSESIGAQPSLFSALSKPHHIFRKVGASRPVSVPRSRNRSLHEGDVRDPEAPERRASGRSTGDLARRAVLDAIAPPSVVVADDGTIVLSHGDLSPFLRIPEGEHPRFELGALLRPELSMRVRGALYKCRRTGAPVSAVSRPEGTSRRIQVSAHPAPSVGEGAVILSFAALPVAEQAQEVDGPLNPDHEAVVLQLEKELTATREDLRTTVEELESSNEELRSSSEESMSMNEELQSTNEELEATTEELRSLNEELTTVNAQLREKVEQLEQAHDDLQNFFASTKVATIFLDDRLCIKRFTPAAAQLLGLSHADVGRHAGDIARELLQNELVDQARKVLEDLSPIGRDLRTSEGRWISRQLLPYRTQGRRIEGVVVTFTDITEMRSSNAMLESRNRRLELAWEAAPGGVFEHGVPLDASTLHNEQLLRLLGHGPGDLPPDAELAAWILGRVHPADRVALQAAYTPLLEGNSQSCKVEFRVRHRSGHWVWVRVVAKPLERRADGSVSRILGVALDISDFKEAQESANESEMRFREMADGLPLMIWVHDAAGDQEMVNQTFCEFFGVTRDDMKGGRWQMLVHPDDAESYTGAFYEAVKARSAFHAEARVKHADGSWHWIESWGRPRMTTGGEFRGLIGTSADVTERRHMESVLKDSEERFRALSDNIPQLAWMARGDGWIFWYNQRWYEFTGTTLEEMQGWGWKSVHHPDHLDRVVEHVSSCFESGDIWEDTFPIRGADGEYRWFLSRAVPIRDEAGRVVRWFGTNTDITEQRKTEQMLVDVSRQKDEFIAMLGHELRNPLAAIRTASELLRRQGDPGVVQRAQSIIERQSVHMAQLLDGLLDVSRVIRGKIEVALTQVDLAKTCREVCADHEEQLEGRPVAIHTELPSGPVWVQGDQVRLTQIVDNLVSNAVKFTSEGSITVALRHLEDGVSLTVRDTGAGIDSELLPHVFEPFRQAHQDLDRPNGGLGLGLALVKALAELHGGRVEARSEGEGAGSEFRVHLPLPREVEPSEPIPAPGRDGPLSVLVVEDNEDTAEMLKALLELSGHRVSLATRGQDGVDAARSRRPDVVLCDLGLPGGMSGFEVARTLRSDPATADITLLAVSGYGRPEDKAKSLESGFDAHLTKPVDIDRLTQALHRHRPAPSGRTD